MLWNFVVDKFFIWNLLVVENYVWISQIWNLNFVNDLGWRNYQYKSFRWNFVVDNFSIEIYLGPQIINIYSV